MPSLAQVDHDPFGQPKQPQLSVVERGFLKVLSIAEQAGAGSTAMRLFNDAIQRGRVEPITEKDFSPGELDAIRSLIQSHAAKSGGKSGHVDYKDYPGGDMLIASRSKESSQVMNSLGGFDYNINPGGSISVNDKYDFNANRAGASDDSVLTQALSLFMNPRNLAASIGRKILPDTSGRGIPVSLSLKPVEHDPFENLTVATSKLGLSPEEVSLYQRHLSNLTGPGGVDNPDGSRSTLYQSVQEHNGRFYNVPTVWDGKIETEKWTDPKTGRVWDVPNKTAHSNFDSTGWEKFPSYATADEADARYAQMHDYMERDTQQYMKSRSPAPSLIPVQHNPFSGSRQWTSEPEAAEPEPAQ